ALVLLGSGDGQPDLELGALLRCAGYFNPATVRLDYTIGKGKTEARTLGARRKERLEDLSECFRRNAAAVVADLEDDKTRFENRAYLHLARPTDGLNAVQNKIQDHLLDQCRVVQDHRQGTVGFKEYLNRLGKYLLACELHGLFDRGVDISGMKIGWTRSRVGKQVVQNILDMSDFVLNVAHNRATGAVRWKLFADYVDHTGNASQGISDFV